MKHIKSFRISEENNKRLKNFSKQADLSEGWIVNQALQMYFEKTKKLNPYLINLV